MTGNLSNARTKGGKGRTRALFRVSQTCLTLAWRPESQYDVAVTRGPSTVAGPTARRDNVLASKCEYPPFRAPLLNVLFDLGVVLMSV